MVNLTVEKIMTQNPATVGPDDSVVYVAKILNQRGFNGLPVVDKENKLVGIITEYDLVSKGDAMHLPTLINILGNVDFYKKDKSLIKDDLKKMLTLKVKDIMNREPLAVKSNATLQELADLFAHHHKVNPIPVVDSDNKILGIVSRFDIVKFFVDESGHREISVSESQTLDKKVEGFVKDFENRFVFVSKTRARLIWPILAFTFAILGFIIAFAIILRITVR